MDAQSALASMFWARSALTSGAEARTPIGGDAALKAPLLHQNLFTARLEAAPFQKARLRLPAGRRALSRQFMRRGLAESLGGGRQERGAIRGRIQEDDYVATLGAGDDVSFKAVLRTNSAFA